MTDPLNPKEFREILYELLGTWTASRPDIVVDELHSLCLAISSIIRLQSRDEPTTAAGYSEGV